MCEEEDGKKVCFSNRSLGRGVVGVHFRTSCEYESIVYRMRSKNLGLKLKCEMLEGDVHDGIILLRGEVEVPPFVFVYFKVKHLHGGA